MTNAREVALDLLCQWPQTRRLADELLDEKLAGTAFSPADRGLVMELFYGCLRQHLALEFLQSRLVARPPRAVVAEILNLGLYQLVFLGTPPHAAVHETVALAKQRASPAEAAFVNAVLRKAATSGREPLASAPPWVRVSHPQWLWERWVARWGAADAQRLCEWDNEPPVVYVRRNTLKHPAIVPPCPTPGNHPETADKRDACPTLPGDHPDSADKRDACPTLPAVQSTDESPDRRAVEPIGFHPLCFRVTRPAELFGSAAWQRGEFYVQDPSTLIAVDVLDPQPGESVLDLCAAPGGKTTYIAQRMQNLGQIVAADSSSGRLGLVGENCRRLGVTIVATLACDGEQPGSCLRGAQFDRVLVDAPCSNTGVLRRRPDLRWRLAAAEITRLAATQEKLLAAAAKVTRLGGVLVYSTCSLEAEENERVVEWFRAKHPAYTLETTRSTFPPRDGVDGAFVARFRRN